MDTMTLSPTDFVDREKLSFLSGEYENKLTESIREFATDCTEGLDISRFHSDVSDLIRRNPDPPVGAIWIYSALTSEKCRLSVDVPHKGISAADYLFQLLAAICSSSCPPKRIALLAPLAFEISTVVVDLWGSLQAEKKLARKIDSLLGEILGYISINFCSVFNWGRTSPHSPPKLADLVRVWVKGRRQEKKEDADWLKLFFPFTSENIVTRLSSGELNISYLAGVVAAEFLLLRLCLKFHLGFSKLELQDNLRTSIVGSMTSSNNCYYFEILMGFLLEPKLPVASLMSSEDESLLRKMMYDAVILVEYSFLKLKEEIELLKSVALTRLIVSHEAIESCRESGDVMKADTYGNAFRDSSLYLQLVQVIKEEVAVESKELPSRNSPKAFLKWLVGFESRGIRIFHDSFLRNRSKLFTMDSQKDEADALFFIDRVGEELDKGDDGMDEETNAAFIAASREIKEEIEGTKKRKHGRREKRSGQVKLGKYNVEGTADSASEESLLVGDEDSASEIDNPT